MKDAPLIQAEELAARLGEPEIRIFDCRFDLARPDYGRQSYGDQHVPGAVHADLNRDLSAPVTPATGRHPLPTMGGFEARLRAWGVNRDSLVIAYDDGNAMYASRLWWMMRWAGHDRVRVLDGGMRRWMQLGLPLDDTVPAFGPGDFVAHPRPELALDVAQVATGSADGSICLLDARAVERYRGEVEPIDAVAGHVPGARNHPFTLSLAADGRLLGADELRRSLASSLAGRQPGETVAMCGSGVTACHLLLAMEVAGLGGGRLYPGSWSEWSRDPGRPVARGTEP
jgi:thiosulfate/3-mercaptopyruvate sulfurtransferase